ncbi:MAG: uroporphyrinogen-III C-methyltransferase, partial [Pseudomonadota bacterium]
SGRLLMHGASKNIPVTIMENVSRPDQKITVSSLGQLVKDAETVGTDGPVILMLGLEPREALSAARLNKDEIANLGSFY